MTKKEAEKLAKKLRHQYLTPTWEISLTKGIAIYPSTSKIWYFSFHQESFWININSSRPEKPYKAEWCEDSIHVVSSWHKTPLLALKVVKSKLRRMGKMLLRASSEV